MHRSSEKPALDSLTEDRAVRGELLVRIPAREAPATRDAGLSNVSIKNLAGRALESDPAESAGGPRSAYDRERTQSILQNASIICWCA